MGCRFRPPPNELLTESGLTVMKIQLPTGVEPYLEDLRQVRLFPPVDTDGWDTGPVQQLDTPPPPDDPGGGLTVGFQFRDTDEPLVSHYELQGDTVVIQMDAVSPSCPQVLVPPGTETQTSCLVARFPQRSSCVWNSGSGAGLW